MPRKVDIGSTRLTWVPGVDAIENFKAPTISELLTGLDLTFLMVSTYEVRFDGSDTTQERSVGDTTNVVVPTVGNYMGRFDLFRDFDEENLPTEKDISKWLKFRDYGFFVRRIGLPQSTLWDEGQEVEVYKFMLDNPQIQGGTGEGNFKAVVPLFQQGEATETAIIAENGS